MATWERAHWEPSLVDAVPRPARQSGPYRVYSPDLLDGRPLAVHGVLSRRIAAVEREIRALTGPGGEDLAGIARFLVRSEAIASSRIEGIASSPQQVALAELGQSESVRGVSEQARLVANNMTIVRRASADLTDTCEVTVDDVVDLHRSLLAEQFEHHDLRTVQNWIGGSSWHPLDAAYVPPDANAVAPLMEDLIDYLNGSAHAALVQAALVHAQFETIHPFTDGNGRVGRALIHTVLARRGLTEAAVLPISQVLATLSDQYIDGLTTYRYDAPFDSAEATLAITTWLEQFVDAAQIALRHSRDLRDHIDDLRQDWRSRLAAYRTSVGLRASPRAGSAGAQLLSMLPEAPVVTATTLARILGVSFPAANSALDEFQQAGILSRKSIDRGAAAYVAREVLDLVTMAERPLASTRFDTRQTPPRRMVPARPDREPGATGDLG